MLISAEASVEMTTEEIVMQGSYESWLIKCRAECLPACTEIEYEVTSSKVDEKLV